MHCVLRVAMLCLHQPGAKFTQACLGMAAGQAVNLLSWCIAITDGPLFTRSDDQAGWRVCANTFSILACERALVRCMPSWQLA